MKRLILAICLTLGCSSGSMEIPRAENATEATFFERAQRRYREGDIEVIARNPEDQDAIELKSLIESTR